MKLKRCGMQEPTFAITTAKSLIKFKKESFKGQGKEVTGSDKGGGDRDKSRKRDKPSKDKVKRQEGGSTKEVLLLLVQSTSPVL